ncbi:MAG: glycerophosphodiester phosphodiesterase family protein [Desulfatitalea sp.]
MKTIPAHDQTLWCIAHRGARDEAPENTRSAFERALHYPIDGIELDVQMSSDGLCVIYHDATLRRVAGLRQRVADLTAPQLAALDWGRWFHRDFSGEPLLTLEATLAAFAPRTRLLIEIKSSPAEQQSGHSAALTRAVIACLSGMPAGIPETNIHILSFDPQVLQLAHRLSPQWHCVLNLPEQNPDALMTSDPSALDGLWAVDGRIGRLSAPLVGWAKENGLRVFTYTCNGPRQVQKALRLGVDAILTDRPRWLTDCLKR